MEKHPDFKPKKSLGSSFSRFFSWVFGLSFGTLGFAVFFALIGTAIFVRTDFFQSELRDAVVDAAQDKLKAKISYEEARVYVFRFFPQVSFTQVKITDEKTDVDVDIEQISVKISPFISLPLLLLRQIHISRAEIKGLVYNLTDLQVLEDWRERLQPEESVIPSRFQTVVSEIHFEDFRVSIDLKKPKPIQAQLRLDKFTMELKRSEILFEGGVNIESLSFKELQLNNATAVIKNARYRSTRTSFGSLRIQEGDDFVEIRGYFEGWDDPNLNMDVDAHIHLERHLQSLAIQAELTSSAHLEGPVSKISAKGKLGARDIRYETKSIDRLDTQFELNWPKLQLDNLRWASGEETGRLEGYVDLNEAGDTDMTLSFEKLQLGEYLGTFNPGLGKWDVLIGGELQLSRAAGQTAGLAVRGDIELDRFIINHGGTGEFIFGMSKARLSLSSTLRDLVSGSFSTEMLTESGSWNGLGEWGDGRLDLRWSAEIENGVIGKLFDYEIAGDGSLKGSYSGPYRQMALQVFPNFKKLSVNLIEIEDMSGEIYFDEQRALIAKPLTAKGLEVNGGLYFPREPGGKTLFSDLNFEFQSFDSEKIFLSVPASSQWKSIPKGVVSGSGHLEDWIGRPGGTGNILARDLSFGSDRTRGRVLKTNWEFKDGLLYFKDSYIETSQSGGGVRGDISFSMKGIHEFNLKGKRVRLADWMLVFGLELPFQSELDFNAQYVKSSDLFEAKMKFENTNIGSRVQKSSSLNLWAEKEESSFDGSFFGDQIQIKGRGRSRQSIDTELQFANFNALPIVKELQGSGIDALLNGSGRCTSAMNASAAREASYLRYLSLPEQTACEVGFQPSLVRRGNVTLHRLEAFSIKTDYKSSQGLAISTPLIRLNTGAERLELQGRLYSKEGPDFRMQGSTSLESISYVIPFLSRAEGLLDVDGFWRKAGFTGSLRVSDGVLLFQDSPIVVREVSASLNAKDSTIDVTELSGEIREGTLSAGGRFHLDGFVVDQAQLQIQLNGPLVEPQRGVRFRTSGPLNIQIQNRVGEISGQLNIYEGFFRRRVNLRSDILSAFQPKDEKYRFFQTEESYLDTWALNIALVTSDPFVVRNNLAEAEFNLNLRLVGTVGAPRLQGGLNLLNGQFTYFNQTFELESGAVQFIDPQSNIPRYDIRAETEIEEYRVFLTLQGDASEQKIIYTSDPPLSEKQILALVSYGTPPEQDEAVRSSDGGASAAYTGLSFVTGQLQDTIEGALSSDLGIRRFQVYPAFYDETGKTELQLTVGTDLVRNRLLLNYSNFLSAEGGHKVELDFKLNRNISLVGSWRDVDQGDERENIGGDLGGDIVFRFEFE